MATKEMSLKLLIDTKAQKVGFAEAGNDVVDFLSTLLCLPVSTVINLLTKERMVGSIGNVLHSLQELDTKYLTWPFINIKKLYISPAVAPSLLHPLQKLLDRPLNVSNSFFTCQGKPGSYHGTLVACGYFSAIKDTICPSCVKPMGVEMKYAKGYGLVSRTVTYTVMDDLSITPASSVSSITVLAQSGVEDLSTLQERIVKIGKEEALEILLCSLKSKTVLTDVFLQKKKVRCKKETAA